MMTLAMPASRSLIALLVGTVAFFALWMIALKPGGSSGGGTSTSQGLGAYQSAINKAHQAVQTSNASNAASGNDGTATSSTPSNATASSGGSAPTAKTRSSSAAHGATKSSKPVATGKAATHSPAALARLSTVQHAIAAHKVVAMLFYNPLAADDQAVKQELAAVPTHRGGVVKLTIPLSEASNFTAVTQQVPVNFSPTLMLIAPGGEAGEIVGFSDRFEIAQRVVDALASK
jgi:hypothetical protein